MHNVSEILSLIIGATLCLVCPRTTVVAEDLVFKEKAAATAPVSGLSPTILTLDMKTIFETNPKTIEEQRKIDASRNQSKNDEEDDLRYKAGALRRDIAILEETLRSGELDEEHLTRTRRMHDLKSTILDDVDENLRKRATAREKELQEASLRLRSRLVAEIMKAIAATPACLTSYEFHEGYR